MEFFAALHGIFSDNSLATEKSAESSDEVKTEQVKNFGNAFSPCLKRLFNKKFLCTIFGRFALI